MKVILDQPILALNGEAFRTGEVRQVPKLDGDGNQVLDAAGNPVMVAEEKVFTVRDVLINAYGAPIDDKATIVERVARGVMAARLYNAKKSVTLTAEEVTRAKDLLGKTQVHPIILMRIIEAIDPGAVPAMPKDDDEE